MRTALLAIFLAFASQNIRAATAYEALRILGKQRDEKVLDAVTEVRGLRGAPQPGSWKIVVNDPKARSGVKEFDVQGTKLVGEKSPASRTPGSPMNMSQLNLDSDGAHVIAEREAKKVGFAYDHADYTLRAGTHGGSPVWEVRLVDDRSGSVATMNLAATTGKVLGSEGFVKRPKEVAKVQPPPPQPPPAAERRPPPPDERGNEPQPRDNASGGAPLEARVGNFFDRVGRHFERRGRQIGDAFHNLFSKDKRHTAGPHDGTDDDGASEARPPQRNSIDEDTTRPSRVRD